MIEPNRIIFGKCDEVLKTFPDNSFDSCVTDPPYLLEFMNKEWDKANCIDPEFGYWFAGFTDGEGCFRIHKQHNDTQTTYTCVFQLKLRDDDDLILQQIKRHLGIGMIHKADGDGNSKGQSIFVVSSQDECITLRDFFNHFPLRAKKQKDFVQWSKHLDLWIAHERGADKTVMKESYEEMKDVRSYENKRPPMNKQAFFHYIWAKEVLRVLKPGAHILVACGTKTQHRLAQGLEDAGFEIRDVITWHYGSGFPKSLDISKAIDKMNGVEREVIGIRDMHYDDCNRKNEKICNHAFDLGRPNALKTETAPATEAAKQWEGWGTALKPATEFWTLARKPISENTVAQNVLKHGTGGINIDGSRIVKQEGDRTEYGVNGIERKTGNVFGKQYGNIEFDGTQGRFPANVILDEFTGKLLDSQTGNLPSGGANGNRQPGANYEGWGMKGMQITDGREPDEGGASRFFYCPKADNYERNKGLNGFEKVQVKHIATTGFTKHVDDNPNYPRANVHPTVKPIDLMRYLVKLITPKKGIVLDPFCGSGTTCIGAKLELINYVGIEMVEEYCKIAEARVSAWNPPKYIEQKLF